MCALAADEAAKKYEFLRFANSAEGLLCMLISSSRSYFQNNAGAVLSSETPTHAVSSLSVKKKIYLCINLESVEYGKQIELKRDV